MSQPQGKTIQIFLPDGNPRGVKIAEFTSRTLQAVLVPRAQLDMACSRKELSRVGLYFLFGEVGAEGAPQVYVGEAEDCGVRLKQHNKTKDWWEWALVCVSKTAEFTKSHVKFLEWHCYQEAAAAGRFAVDNSTVPTKSHVSESMEADLLDHFETLRILSGTFGYPLFDHIKKSGDKNLLICKGKKAMATGEYTEDGLVVFAKSTANRAATKSSSESSRVTRARLIEQGVLAPVDDDTYIFTKDHVFRSPSQAADVVLGRSANGWIDWKYSDGRTLDEVKRKSTT